MSNIDKEWLQKKIAEMEAARDEIPFGLDEDDSNTLAALRIALASLEAEPAIHRWRRVTSEPYGPYPWHYGDFIGFSKPVDGIEDEYFYSAPPAPANAEPAAWLWSHRKHPSEVTLVRPEDDEKAEGAHWSGWSCQALYAAPPAPVSVPDEVNVLLNHLEDVLPDEAFNLIDVKTWNNVSMLSRPDVYRAAMLQGAEPVTTAYKLPDDFDFDRFNDVVWLEAVASNPHMHSPITSTIAMVALELNKRLEAGNSPVIPDGWKLVPIELTGDMTNAMSEAILDDLHNVDVWRSVLAAEPQQEVK
ncbi:hypothetical protein [Enterobacter kobei]|uniref:hypothetical protein n=1 Tax=Enterobacter kobei TaxID=208224 RepID=UPI003BEEB77B